MIETPVPPPDVPPPDPTELLRLPLPANDADADTVGEYLAELLCQIWRDGENAVKRPFGNSGWQHEICVPMIKAGLIKATWNDHYESWDEIDYRAVDKLITDAVLALFTRHAAGQPTAEPAEGN